MKKFDEYAERIQAARDQEIIENIILEIMENRGVTREEALKILGNPF